MFISFSAGKRVISFIALLLFFIRGVDREHYEKLLPIVEMPKTKRQGLKVRSKWFRRNLMVFYCFNPEGGSKWNALTVAAMYKSTLTIC